jgi:alkyl hydroperoxide reductase subunit AhpC
VRSVFIIDPNKVIRLILTYPASCGRNFDGIELLKKLIILEIIRVLDSLQLTSYKQVATPVNWKKNEDVIVVPSLKDEDAKKLFGEIKIVKPYLRYTKYPGDPNK